MHRYAGRSRFGRFLLRFGGSGGFAEEVLYALEETLSHIITNKIRNLEIYLRLLASAFQPQSTPIQPGTIATCVQESVQGYGRLNIARKSYFLVSEMRVTAE